jgi:hypothetical protein
MKNIFPPLFFLFISFSCSNFHNSDKFAKIDLSTIEVAEIKKSLYDTVSVRLSDKQTAQFAEYINTTKGVELLKAVPQYWIFVKFKPDSVKLYKIHYDLIGDGDSYIKIADTTYFKDIYENNNKGPHFISVKNGLP